MDDAANLNDPLTNNSSAVVPPVNQPDDTAISSSPPVTPPPTPPPASAPVSSPLPPKEEEVITLKSAVKPKLVTGGLLPKLLPLGIVTLLILAILGGIKLMTKPQAPENACETGNCNCTGLHLYDTQNNPLTADKISPGQTVRIGMGTTGTNVWKVRFKVNDGDWQETDQTKFSPQIGYYFDLPIPAAGGTFTITGNVCCGPVVTVTTEPGATPITQCVWK